MASGRSGHSLGMSEPDEDLVTDEGVDEGSAAMSSEGDAGPSGDVLGPDPAGSPTPPQQEPGPDPVETIESRRAHDGQQLEVGEG